MRISDWSSDVCSSDLVHLALVPRAVVEAVELLDMQGVHIGAQADGAAGPVALAVQHPDDAGGGEAAVHLDAELGQLLGHEVGGAQLLESGLGVGVDVAAPALHLVVEDWKSGG